MGVSEVTAEIARAIANLKSPLTAREAFLLYVLQGMPLFRDINGLAKFDRAYNDVAPDDDKTSTEELIDALYWLGADCFYGAYSEDSTRRYYHDRLMPSFANAGIKLPDNPDLSKW